MKKRKYIFKCMTCIFCLFIFGIVVCNVIKKDRTFSEQENRMLAEKPTITWKNITSGKFMKQYETYQSDQFVGRDMWMKVKTGAQTMLGKRESNGVFKGKQNTLMERIVSDEGEYVEENLKAIQAFADKNYDRKTYFLLAPNAANVWEERLPGFAETNDQSKEILAVKNTLKNYVSWIDAESALKKHKGEEIFYHTDHHWTSLGAYYAFQEAKNVMGLDEKWDEQIKSYPVTADFNGTLSAKSGYETNYEEVISVYFSEKEGTEVVVQDLESGEKRGTLYDVSKLNGKDKYAVFLGGNFGALDIQTTSEAKEKLLILKDSYANCFIPFLVPYYREIIVVDPRYYYGDLQSLIDDNNIDSILYLYNANTFFSDNNISVVLQPEK